MLINDWGDMSEAQEPTLDREFLSSLKDIKVSATTVTIGCQGAAHILLAEPKNRPAKTKPNKHPILSSLKDIKVS